MSSPQKTVIIVDDDADTAEMFAEMMRVGGYRIVKTSRGSHATQIIAAEKPDIVILDIMMPDISGLEVLRFMRREPNLRKIPVILVSAKSMPSDIKVGMEAGASRYFTKPVSFIDLRKAVDELVTETDI